MIITVADLVGEWESDPGDQRARDSYGEVAMEFHEGGFMKYVIREGTKEQIMFLRYRVEGDELITDQPSAPREERTRFRFTSDGRLVLEYEGLSAHYVRRPSRVCA
jgi:hypothetical protein